jgi:dTDP-4-amino-4,6-dideoxygalactose transaminase
VNFAVAKGDPVVESTITFVAGVHHVKYVGFGGGFVNA